MKKLIAMLSCCAVLAACSNNNENAAGDEKAADQAYNDATSDAETSAAAKQSEVDTSINDIGTSNTGTAETAAAGTGDTYEKGKKLIAQSDCLSCHQTQTKLVGPAYEEVAKKYEMNDKNVDYLAQKIIAGGAGVWGQIPMTPHPDLSKEDAAEMAKYVLSLKK
ncbi:c-type cytochrome [Pontibacter liquoris]|uniref:c-type cytochrome n=1 Tax=Pontibacter liquoris TaxID=2905677 RepID=UPI001FA792D1|nr:c-type cytochrome [Pontibacter liquoris]